MICILSHPERGNLVDHWNISVYEEDRKIFADSRPTKKEAIEKLVRFLKQHAEGKEGEG